MWFTSMNIFAIQSSINQFPSLPGFIKIHLTKYLNYSSHIDIFVTFTEEIIVIRKQAEE